MNRAQRRAASKWLKATPNPQKFLKSLEDLHSKLVPVKEQLEQELKKVQSHVQTMPKAAE